MAEQSFLNKMGMRLGVLGSAASLAIAAPLANLNYDPSCHTDAARIGDYFDRTVGAEKYYTIVGGQSGPFYSTDSSLRVQFDTTGQIMVGNGTASATLLINGMVGFQRELAYRTGTQSNRWLINVGNGAESGSNAGSAITIGSRSDSNVSLGFRLTLTRAALGLISWGSPTLIAAGTLTGSQTALAMSATWNNAATTFIGFALNGGSTAAASTSLLCDFKIGGVSRFSIAGYSTATGYGALTSTVVDDGTAIALSTNRVSTITVGINDGNGFLMNTAVNGLFTVTRLNWFNLDNPTGSATITNATVFDFDAAPGVHKCIDAGTTKTSPTAVSAWIKHNINGTIYFSNAYTSKTS